jgi:hypothetical protein
MKQVIKISQVKNNPNNPRVIKDHDFYVLVNSIKTTPGFMEFRPVIIDYNNMVLCGNQRLRACIYLGHKEIWTDLFTQEKADEMNKEAQKEGRPTKTYLEYCKAITIVDNTHAGTWDWDMLANEWDSVELDEWGLSNWKNMDDIETSDSFTLPDGDKAPFQQMTFTLADKQAEQIKNAIADIKQTEEYKYTETMGNENSNGNALYLIIMQWAEQKK